ncbi:hypothetical protein AB3N58_10390 [Leptospira sp. WS60.C2]
MKNILLTVIIGILSTMNIKCGNNIKFKIGDCVILNSSNKSSEIIKIVSITNHEYKYFTHFYVNGQLIQAEDYQTNPIDYIETQYSKTMCPEIDGTFSPDKYLNKKGF